MRAQAQQLRNAAAADFINGPALQAQAAQLDGQAGALEAQAAQL